jgi:methionine-rich copper-binding protein CopC
MRIQMLPMALLAAFAVAGPASAHAILMESTPALQATVPAGPVPVTLRFNSRIDRARSRVTLVRPGADPVVLPVPASGAEDRLETKADLPPGPAVIRWQVLAVDGHITRGDVPITVTAPGASAGTPPGTPKTGN